MSSIPSNLNRVPNLLASRMQLSNLTRTQLDLLRLQGQLATGNAVNKPSDDAVRAATITVLDGNLERADLRLRNLNVASNSLGLLDVALEDATNFLQEAKSIASSQIGVGSDETTRRLESTVIESFVREMYSLVNRNSNGLYLFGGSTATQTPVVELNGGFRYVGRGEGLYNDIATGDRIPITLGSLSSIGAVSARVRSTADLSPTLTGGTLLRDMAGARGRGITVGEVSVVVNGGAAETIDLTAAQSAQDIADALTAGLRAYEQTHAVSVLGPGGVMVGDAGFEFDLVPGPPPPVVQISEVGNGVTAQDLGLAQDAFTAGNTQGLGLGPRLTLETPVSAVDALASQPLGSIRIRMEAGSGEYSAVVDLSGATTIDQIRDRIEGAGLGVRVVVNEAGTGIDVLNEVSGHRMSVEEVGDGSTTASRLGIRSYTAETLISDFNHGDGVRIVDGRVHPESGQPEDLNDDFLITLATGQQFSVDLRPSDLTTVQAVLDRINAGFQLALTQSPRNPDAPPLADGDFIADLSTSRNGIRLRDLTAGPGELSVEKLNNSAAAEDLGLLDGRFDAPSATLIAQDRATVRVDSLFSDLIDLRDALAANDEDGIAIAGERLESSLERLSSARALVGVYANRVEGAKRRQEDAKVLDETMKSGLQGLDYAEAAMRLSLLQTQLSAGLQVSARLQGLSLLDYLS